MSQYSDPNPESDVLLHSVKNVNELEQDRLTMGHRIADRLTQIIGSWKFIIIQSVFLACWVILNLLAWYQQWDPYPFILLNLFLSLQAAYTAPIIMMSQNRQTARDRLEAHNDYLINKKSEMEIRIILKKLELQNKQLEDIQRALEK